MEGFRLYLQKAQQLLRTKPVSEPLKVCLGNVSVDVDSVIGSMTLAYYYSLKLKQVYIPIVNCKRSFFPMKLDIISHLESCNFKTEQLNFYNECTEILDHIDEVALIDHNKLDPSEEAELGKKVARIVDHHIDNNLYADQLKEKQIELIGSATTLAIEKLITEYPEYIDRDFAYFLQGPLVIDSYFFNEGLKGSKWTEKDWDIYQYLDKMTGSGKQIFDTIAHALMNVELNLKLGIDKLLVKDYKTYLIQEGTMVGLGTVYIALGTLKKHFGLEAVIHAMDALMKEKGLEFYGILTNYQGEKQDEYHKECLLYCNESLTHYSTEAFDKFVEHMISDKGYQLKLVDQQMFADNGSKFYQFEVGNKAYSRKNFEKLMVQYFSSKGQ